jgi:NET1-associated nuclear protein 1 (U3 small nucleolar RNA-associated protein 17)
MWGHHPAPLAVHTQSTTVILPAAHPSSLLIYSPVTSTLISELEVSPSNRVSRQDEKHIEPSRIKHVEVSTDGEWLATIDGRDGGDDFQNDVYLKIWQWHAASTSWELNSRIDRPHGTAKVSALVFAPAHGHQHLLSTGEDGNVKVWRVRSVTTKNGEKEGTSYLYVRLRYLVMICYCSLLDMKKRLQ